jgi:hypothetical protein
MRNRYLRLTIALCGVLALLFAAVYVNFFFSREPTPGTVSQATIKYDSSGRELWVARYTEPGYNYSSHAITTDNNGNTYVLGKGNIISSPNNSRKTFTTVVKYDKNGSRLWVNNSISDRGDYVSGQVFVALDKPGNVCVGEESLNTDGFSGFVISNYDINGRKQWESHYSNPGFSYDMTAFKVADCGDIYVSATARRDTGEYSCQTVKFSSAGHILWSASYEGYTSSSLELDANENAYVCGAVMPLLFQSFDSSPGKVIIKYDREGKQLLNINYYGSTDTGDFSGLAIDTAGNIFFTGQSRDRLYTVIKYDNDGNKMWAVSLYPDLQYQDKPYNLFVDATGNAYISGQAVTDYFTIKYNPSGQEEWCQRYPAKVENRSVPVLAVDSQGNVYLGGARTLFYDIDFLTVKYDGNGQQLWAATYDGRGRKFGYSFDKVDAMVVDIQGNIYVTGSSSPDMPTY